jgi:hypothetical protein
MNTITAATAFLAAKEALEAAQEAKAQAEAILKEAYAKAGVDSEIVDGVKVALVTTDRPNYDAEALRDLVSGPLFRTVTKATVDSTKWKAAVALGKIQPEVADAITTVTTSVSVRTTALKAEAKKADRKAA